MQNQTRSVTFVSRSIGITCYLFAIVAPAVTAALYDEQVLDRSRVYLGLSTAGITAFAIIAMQFVLAARIPWIEEHFGFKAVLKLHKTMAVVAAILALVHVGLLVGSRENWNLVLSLRVSWPVFLGRFCVVALVVMLAYSFCRNRLPINNADWRWFHNVLAWTILLSGFGHGITIGASFENSVVTLVWIGYFLIAMAAWVSTKCRMS